VNTRPPSDTRLPLVLAALVLLLGLALRVTWFHVGDRSPDEMGYTSLAAGIAREGPGWQAHAVRAFNRDGKIYPWPHRFGFVALYAVFIRLTGRATVETGELMSTVASLAAMVIVGAIAFGEIDPWVGVVAMLFLATSPLDLELARRAWQDDVTSLLALGMLWTFLHAARGRRSAWNAFFAIGGFSLLVKESLLIPFGLGVAGLAWSEWRRARGWAAPARVLAIGVAVAVVAAGTDIIVNGGWREMRALLVNIQEPAGPDEYERHYQSGGIGYYLTGMRILQPQVFLLGYVATALALLGARGPLSRLTNPRARPTLAAIAIFVGVFSAIAFAYTSKNLRFLSPIFGPIALLAASLVVAGLRAIPARAAPLARRAVVAGALVALLASATHDVFRFHHYFIEYEIEDLATPWFTEADSGKL